MNYHTKDTEPLGTGIYFVPWLIGWFYGRDTQAVLEEELGLSPHMLVRGIFQGQHHVNGLLESTDAQLKEELALLVCIVM